MFTRAKCSRRSVSASATFADCPAASHCSSSEMTRRSYTSDTRKCMTGGARFFGLRDVDLKRLEGRNGFICLLVDDGSPPIFIPYADFEEIFRTAEPAGDGQYKVQLIAEDDSRQLYIARKGRFNVEGFVGFGPLEQCLEAGRLRPACNLSHSQVQTLLGGVGRFKGFEVWIPDHDIGTLDWSLTGVSPSRLGYRRVSTMSRLFCRRLT